MPPTSSATSAPRAPGGLGRPACARRPAPTRSRCTTSPAPRAPGTASADRWCRRWRRSRGCSSATSSSPTSSTVASSSTTCPSRPSRSSTSSRRPRRPRRPCGASSGRARRPRRRCTPSSTRATRSRSCSAGCRRRRCDRSRGWGGSSTSGPPSPAVASVRTRSVEVDLLVDDAEAPANSGRWTLAVSAGRGTATRADDAARGRERAPGRGAGTVGAVVRMVRVAPAPSRARHGRHPRG